MKSHIFLDIDGVLATTQQFYSNRNKWPEYGCYRFDEKCVKVFNEILRKTDPIIILSSDWKLDYSIEAMNNIFEINKIEGKVFDFTTSLWDVKYKSLNDLEICRAEEILLYVNDNNISKYVAIDDLDLSKWISNNFVHTPKVNEGIKQTGVKDKILKVLNYEQK